MDVGAELCISLGSQIFKKKIYSFERVIESDRERDIERKNLPSVGSLAKWPEQS